MRLRSLDHIRLAELMDDPGLPEADHLHALGALATINAVSRTAVQIAAAVAAIVPPEAPGPIRVVDLACGGGDVTVACGRSLAPALGGQAIVMTGVDISRLGLDRARALVARVMATGASTSLRYSFAVRDLVADGCPPCDVAINSLFLHHLDDGPAVGILRSMAESCSMGFVISDLIRSRIGLGLAVLGTSVLSTSRVARIDGPRSVRAARTPSEYRRLLDDAGLTGALVRRTWPERVLLTWRREDR